MFDPLTKAFNTVDRIRFRASKAVADVAGDLLAAAPGAAMGEQRLNLSNAASQLAAFRSWVYCAIRPIAQTIAGQSIRVGKMREKRELTHKPRPEERLPGGRLHRGAKSADPTEAEPLDSHPLLDALNDPNDLMVAWHLMFATVASLELTGRCLWYCPIEDGRRRLYPIPTSWIEGFEGTTSYQAWKVRPSGSSGSFSVPADQAAYFFYNTPGDPRGAFSPLQAVGASVDADDAILASQRAMFRQGINPGFAILLGKNAGPDGTPTGFRPRLNQAQRKQLLSSVRKFWEGVHRHNEPLILDAMIEDVKKLSHTPAEMDWLGSGKIVKERIMQAFGTSPIIGGEVAPANKASALAAEEQFCKFTVNPKIVLLSQCLTEWLGPLFAADGERLVVWIETAEPRDAELELKRLDLLVKCEAITKDELRAELGFPEMPYGGDLPVGTIDSIGNAIDQQVNDSMAAANARSLFIPSHNGHALNRG